MKNHKAIVCTVFLWLFITCTMEGAPPAVYRQWEEMGRGSASGGGISNNTSVSWCPSLVIDRSDNPIVAWQDDSSGNSEIYVKRWDGKEWGEMGRGSASGGGISKNHGKSEYPCVRSGVSGNIMVAWQDSSSQDAEIYILRWKE